MDFKNSKQVERFRKERPFLKTPDRACASEAPLQRDQSQNMKLESGFHSWSMSAFQGRDLPFWQQPLAKWSGSNPAASRLCCSPLLLLRWCNDGCKLLWLINTFYF